MVPASVGAEATVMVPEAATPAAGLGHRQREERGAAVDREEHPEHLGQHRARAEQVVGVDLGADGGHDIARGGARSGRVPDEQAHFGFVGVPAWEGSTVTLTPGSFQFGGMGLISTMTGYASFLAEAVDAGWSCGPQRAAAARLRCRRLGGRPGASLGSPAHVAVADEGEGEGVGRPLALAVRIQASARGGVLERAAGVSDRLHANRAGHRTWRGSSVGGLSLR